MNSTPAPAPAPIPFAKKHPFTYGLRWAPLTQKDADWAKAMLGALPDTFAYLKMAEVKLSTSCCVDNVFTNELGEEDFRENDTLEINGSYSITRVIRTKTTETLASITHREVFNYVIMEPCLIRGGFDHPDEWDAVEMTVTETLGDAIRAIFLREAEGLFDSIAECLAVTEMHTHAFQAWMFDDIPY